MDEEAQSSMLRAERGRGKGKESFFMIKFWYVLKLVWIERMAYRVNFFLEILSGIIATLIVVFLWMAVYRGAGRGAIGGYSLAEMITYLLGSGLINTFILNTAENPETSQSIQDGTLSGLLIQPISPCSIWLARDLGSKVFFAVLGLIGYGVVFLCFRNYILLSVGLQQLLLFALAAALGGLLQFLLFQALSLLAFWVENTYGLRFTMRVIMEVVGGAIIPLSFFPQTLQAIFSVLPFPLMIYLPMRIYLGKISADEVMLQFLAEGAWIVGLAFLNMVIWQRGVRRYVSMGD